MTVALGAAVDFIQKYYGGRFEEDDATVAVATTSTKIVDNNPDCLALTIINLGSNTLILRPGDAPSSTAGVLLVSAGGSVTMNVRDDLTLPTREWYGIGSGGATTAYYVRVNRFHLPATS